MKIEKVERTESFSVITNEDEYSAYLRYSENNWYQWMGESLEPFYDSEEIEKLFKKYVFDNAGEILPKTIPYDKHIESISLYKSMCDNLLEELKIEKGIKDYLVKSLKEAQKELKENK